MHVSKYSSRITKTKLRWVWEAKNNFLTILRENVLNILKIQATRLRPAQGNWEHPVNVFGYFGDSLMNATS